VLSAKEKGLSEKKLLLITVILVAIIVIPVIALLVIKVPGLKLPGIEKVAVIKVTGVLTFEEYSLLGSTISARDYIELIKQAKDDPTIKAVVLRVDSPGGDAAASEALYYAVKELAEEKTVVAYIEGLGASGAYEMILPSHYVMAGESSIVGAVGVYSTVITMKELMEKLGVKVYVYKSGKLKDLGSPYREPTEEDEKVLREIVEDMFETFKSRVLEHRGEVSDEVFTGRPFTAKRALEAGLIDQIGTLEDAIKKAKELSGLPEDAPVEELEPTPPSLFPLFGGATWGIRVVPGYQVLAIWPPPTVIIHS